MLYYVGVFVIPRPLNLSKSTTFGLVLRLSDTCSRYNR